MENKIVLPIEQPLTLDVLAHALDSLSDEERSMMNRRSHEIVATTTFRDYESYLVAKDMFEKGYLAALIGTFQ